VFHAPILVETFWPITYSLWKSVKHSSDRNVRAGFQALFLHSRKQKLLKLKGARTAMRRRVRQPDPLASPQAIREVLAELRRRCPDLIPASDRKMSQMMHAVRHIERYSASDSTRGRPGQFDREVLLEVSRHLKAVIERHHQDRISVTTFIGFYLPILDYPPDVIAALESGDINRLEASLLARLTPERLDVKPKKALAIRQELLRNHLKIQGSQTQLRWRVAELLGAETLVTSENMTAAVHQVDDLLSVEEDDRRHLFYEQMKEFFFAMRDIRPEEVDDQTLEEILEASDQLMAVIYKIRLKRKQQVKAEKKTRKLFST
jgi:hypothetical protein